MQLIDKKTLEKNIDEAKKEGKDTSQLEKTLLRFSSFKVKIKMRFGEIKKVGKYKIVSTGCAREEDFEET